ncbi:MAG: hypothetical protein ACKVS8_03975 [Phycisphaerales bacterium]
MPNLLLPDIPLPELLAARKQAFRTLCLLATDLDNQQQARLAAMALLAIPLPDSEAAVPAPRPSRVEQVRREPASTPPPAVGSAAGVGVTPRQLPTTAAPRPLLAAAQRLLALTQKKPSHAQRLLARAGSG